MAMKTDSQTSTTLLNVLTSARTELKTLVERGIDLAERRSKAIFRFARSVTKRLDARLGSRLGGRAKKRRS